MPRFLRTASLLVLVLSSVWAVAAPGDDAVALVGGVLIDGNGGPAVENGVVVVRGDRIEAAGSADAVSLSWPGGDPPAPGLGWIVLRSDGDPSGGFVGIGTPATTPDWRDLAATGTGGPLVHVFFYDVRLWDGCATSED